jgi:hypothetical protein
VGKTRLALECLGRARRAGLATVRATATRSAASIPFGALAGALSGGNGQISKFDGWPDLLRRSKETLAERSAGRHLVLFVDDAHLLDDASATLIHQLAADVGTLYHDLMDSLLGALKANRAAYVTCPHCSKRHPWTPPIGQRESRQ